MEGLLYRGWNWCKRFRYRKGYGVHSPSDFFFINFIVYEDDPYYAYDALHHLRRVVAHLPHYREKVDRLIFRIVNYLQPQTAIEVGTASGLTARYMAEAKKELSVYSFCSDYCDAVIRILSFKKNISYAPITDLKSWLHTQEKIDLLHLSFTTPCDVVFEEVYPYLHSGSCIIIGKPYLNDERETWWKHIIKDSRVGVTFDLKDIGIIFMDKQRVKEHRIVNFL